jgi:diguanylate cyclase (GGDEF)-like protein
MRLFGRNDLVLLGGLTLALFVVFSRPLARLLDYAQGLDQSHGLRLLPALIILATVFIVHQIRKRKESRAEAHDAAQTARLATERAVEMARVVAFGQALARSLDENSIRAAASLHLPILAPGRDAWTMILSGNEWSLLSSAGDVSVAERERSARLALGEVDPTPGTTSADVCFPLIVAGRPMGVLGISPEPPLSDHQRSILAASAALLAVSLKNAELFREVHESSVRDGLTGCFTRKHGLEVMDAELRRARRSRTPSSVTMFDLDRFKEINDRHGHLCGDAVLSHVGARMKAVLRGSDLKCRYGGEEFLVLLPDTPLAGARRVAESLRHDIEAHPVHWNGETIRVTASFGVTDVAAGEIDTLAVLARADGALYRAKQAGRNCLRIDEHHEILADP